MLELALKISLCTLGFRAITGKGMILYFMRGWLDKKSELKKCLDEYIKRAADEIKETTMSLSAGKRIIDISEARIYRINIILYIMKPLILCSTCMASVHTLIWWPYFTHSYTLDIIPVMLIVAILNTLIWAIVEKLTK